MTARATIMLKEQRDRPGSIVVVVEPRSPEHPPKFFVRLDRAEAFAERLREQTGLRLYNEFSGLVR